MFVEQVLIGGTLFLVILLLFPEKAQGWTPNGTLYSVLFGATALGAAYILGIVYDRVADTLLEDQEQRSRLKHAMKRLERGRVTSSDLFPVSHFRIQVLAAGEGISEHAAYLRSRIRLLRALTTLVPALAVAYAVYGLMCKKPGWENLRLMGVGGILLVYGAVLFYKTSDWLEKKLRDKWQDKPPKTYFDPKKYSFDDFCRKIEKHLEKRWAFRDPVFLGLGVLLLLTGFLEANKQVSTFWILPSLGLALTLICGWAFFRVQKTYLTLLDDYNEYKNQLTKKANCD